MADTVVTASSISSSQLSSQMPRVLMSLTKITRLFWQREKISFIACRTNSVYKSEGSTITASFTAPFVKAFDVH